MSEKKNDGGPAFPSHGTMGEVMENDTEAKAWAKRVVDESMEGLSQSMSYCGIVTDNFLKNPLCATQLGMSIFMDKPIILIVKVGTIIPESLKRVAYEIIYFHDANDLPNASKRMSAVLNQLEAERNK